jgi:hypothetical protein
MVRLRWIHFMSANQQGLQSGARLGRLVVEKFLNDRQGHDHRERKDD